MNYLGVREWKNDEELVSLLALRGLFPKACRRTPRGRTLRLAGAAA